MDTNRRLTFSLITNDADLAIAAEDAGIDRILIDLEILGKAERQAGCGLFLSDHRAEDVARLRARLHRAAIMVRVNPWNASSGGEIERAIGDGADALMLPMFTRRGEVEAFAEAIAGRARCVLLLETREGMDGLESILEVQGIDELHVGLNDLRLSCGADTIFDFFLDGTLDRVAVLCRAAGVSFGCGGMARLSNGRLPVDPGSILAEQARLGCSGTLLGRSFRAGLETPAERAKLVEEVRLLREHFARWQGASPDEFEENRRALARSVQAWKASRAVRGVIKSESGSPSGEGPEGMPAVV